MRSAFAVSLFAAGCSLQGPPTSPDAGAQPVAVTRYAPRSDAGTLVSGYVWDPEAYWMSVAACGQNCPIPPLAMTGIPHFMSAVVPGAKLSLFDPIANAPVASTTAGPLGTWHLSHVPSRSTVPFFPFAGALSAPTPTDGGTAVSYLPTLTLRPISTGGWAQCLAISSLQASNAGILDAVAKAESESGGTTVTPADLVDPQKYGGVGVFWLFLPGDSALRVPAQGTRVTSSAGRTLHVDWAPVGALPPNLSARQSPRGFFVTDADTSAMGITVVLLPPSAGPPSPVTLELVDPTTDAAQGRPWSFIPLAPLVLAPGLVSYAEMQALLPAAPAGLPPSWLCLP